MNSCLRVLHSLFMSRSSFLSKLTSIILLFLMYFLMNVSDFISPFAYLKVGLMLRGMGFDKSTSIYLASGQIYNAEKTMAPLLEMFPHLQTKETLASEEELAPFKVGKKLLQLVFVCSFKLLPVIFNSFLVINRIGARLYCQLDILRNIRIYGLVYFIVSSCGSTFHIKVLDQIDSHPKWRKKEIIQFFDMHFDIFLFFAVVSCHFCLLRFSVLLMILAPLFASRIFLHEWLLQITRSVSTVRCL